MNRGQRGVTGPVPELPPGSSFSPFPPNYGTTRSAPVAPPAISGGTLRILADGHTAVAADPDRDDVYIVDLTTKSVRATIALNARRRARPRRRRRRADAPTSRFAAAARWSASTPSPASLLERRASAPRPRGLAYDAATDLVHVACADGQLVSLPGRAAATRSGRVTLTRDLRDVVVDGPRLRVSRFLSAELLTVEADGTVSGRRRRPGSFRAVAARGGQLFTPGVAWKMAEMPDGSGVMMLHQRGVDDEVQPVVGGYGGPDAVQRHRPSGRHHGLVRRQRPQRAGDGGPGARRRHGDLARRQARRVRVGGQRHQHVCGRPAGSPDLPQVFVSDTDQRHRRRHRLPARRDARPVQPAGSSRMPIFDSTGTAGSTGTATSRTTGDGAASHRRVGAAAFPTLDVPPGRRTADRGRLRRRAARSSCSRASPPCWRSPTAPP